MWDYFYLGEKFNLHEMFSLPVRTHFWFMYVMVGICITIPLWQKLVSGDSKALLHYFSVTFIAVMIVNFILSLLKMDVSYEIPLIGSSFYAGYFIMGYAIRHYIDDIKIKKWVCVTVLLICVASTNLLTFFFTKKLGTHYEGFSNFRSVFIGVAAMIVFYMVLKMCNPKHSSWVSFVSKHSFNIYMIHVFFLDILQQNIEASKVNAWWGTPIFFIFMLSLSLIMSWFYEKAKGKRQTIL